MKNLYLITFLTFTLLSCTKNVENNSNQTTNSPNQSTSPTYKNGLFTLKADNVWNDPQPKISVSLSVNKLLLSDTSITKVGYFRVKKYQLDNSQIGYSFFANFEPSTGGLSQLCSIAFISNYKKDPNETQISINASLYDDIYVIVNTKRYKGTKLTFYHEKGNIESGSYEFNGTADSGATIVCKGNYSLN